MQDFEHQTTKGSDPWLGDSQVAVVVKNLPAYAGDVRSRFDPWVRKIPWRRAWQTIPRIRDWENPWTEELGELQS